MDEDNCSGNEKVTQRKVYIFMFATVVGVVSKYLMPIEYYTKFLEFLLWIAIGFFAGNGIEHIAGGLKKSPAPPDNYSVK